MAVLGMIHRHVSFSEMLAVASNKSGIARRSRFEVHAPDRVFQSIDMSSVFHDSMRLRAHLWSAAIHRRFL